MCVGTVRPARQGEGFASRPVEDVKKSDGEAAPATGDDAAHVRAVARPKSAGMGAHGGGNRGLIREVRCAREPPVEARGEAGGHAPPKTPPLPVPHPHGGVSGAHRDTALLNGEVNKRHALHPHGKVDGPGRVTGRQAAVDVYLELREHDGLCRENAVRGGAKTTRRVEREGEVRDWEGGPSEAEVPLHPT